MSPLPAVPELDSSQDLASPTSPAARTGPPRSLSLSFTSPGSPTLPKLVRRHDTVQGLCEDGEFSFSLPGGLRGALECANTASPRDKKGKGRATSVLDETVHVHDSPIEEHSAFDFNDEIKASDVKNMGAKKKGKLAKSPDLARVLTQRTSSTRYSDSPKKGWARLRSLLPTIVERERSAPTLESQTTSINITDELIGSGLSTLMLGLWFQRDEKGCRRIPVLLHRLRIHISDSVNPMHIYKSAFRIECDYANGAARWVIYRELRDFLHLHMHYALSKVYNRNVDKLPDFPKSSIPQWKILKKDDARSTRAEFARKQREALKDYLVRLIRAVMFLPCGNRLAHFFELSTLFISLAQTGGIQLKAGFMKIRSLASSGGGFGRKSVSRYNRSEYRWCAVRDSYLVVVDEPGEDGVWDVFLFDPHFDIERPKRYYRQGFNLLRPSSHVDRAPPQPKSGSWLHSLPHKLSNICSCSGRPPKQPDPFQTILGTSVSLDEFPSHLPTPMLDPSTNITPLVRRTLYSNGNCTVEKKKWNESTADVSKHTFFIVNSQVKLELRARSERQLLQWINALQKTMSQCHYANKNRFDSFAPVRSNVAAQWLVDGRDYFWNLSRAILLARECIYIHDWWLSPELQMRRTDKSHYRLDHLLERKAEEGVKIYVILYNEVSNWTTPIDSNYTKRKLKDLHPNIMVQRSPSHFQTGTFYWAHHEKLCVIDETIAFMGGIDLCFGRWDTPQHVLTDDGPPQSHIWPGKDYSNPRSRDFYDLHKPFEDMYDRSKTPRMPWHDVGLQVVGQPARDLARHFIQRWNWLLRIKNHSREMPCLLPPPEFKENELSQMGLTGTCELQICRSAGPWSLGTLGHIEHSIQSAYIEAIEHSEHFVYIENQFFITSTFVNETKVENQVGDALVNRIIRANREKTPWKCCIVIPLLPGFTFPVDHPDSSALRIILDCQNRSLFWGPYSIFSRLRKENIDPDNFISIFSLRNWGKSRDDTLMTEQVYIHSKICIVDDRLAIIGSANINERSQRGDRDSEIAAIVRDTDLVDGMMAGKQFKVGRFAHSLRIRLMHEHLGIDVDALNEHSFAINEHAMANDQSSYPDVEQESATAAQVRGFELGGRVSSPIHDARDGIDDNCEQVATHRPRVEPSHFEDPVADVFWKDTWMASAIHNTEIYHKVFNPVPNDTITTWKQYKELVSHHKRKNKMNGWSTDKTGSSTEGDIPSREPSAAGHESLIIGRRPVKRSAAFETSQGSVAPATSRKSTKALESTDEMDTLELEKMLCELNGHLVLYPMKFLEGEVMANNFLFNAEKILPLLIYD